MRFKSEKSIAQIMLRRAWKKKNLADECELYSWPTPIFHEAYLSDFGIEFFVFCIIYVPSSNESEIPFIFYRHKWLNRISYSSFVSFPPLLLGDLFALSILKYVWSLTENPWERSEVSLRITVEGQTIKSVNDSLMTYECPSAHVLVKTFRPHNYLLIQDRTTLTTELLFTEHFHPWESIF